MANYHKFVKASATNVDFDYPRGSPVDNSMFDILTSDDIEQVPLEFGRTQKDIVEFSVYANDNTLLASKLVERNETFVNREYDFLDYNGEQRIGKLSTFDRNYPVTENSEVILSPTHELKNLGYTDGTHTIGISFRNDIIGSSESSAKLVIKNISPSRTELKVMPSSLKTSRKPLELALNFEYENFFNKRLLVAHIYNETFKFVKTEGILAYINRVIDDNEIEGYADSVYEIVAKLKMNSYQDVAEEVSGFHDKVAELFFNVMLWKYNQVFTEQEFAREYVTCVDRILDTSTRFANKQVDASLSDVYDVYRTTLIAQYDNTRVSAIYSAKFNSYFSNILNFGNGRIVSFINAVRGTENINDTRKHRPLVIKLIDPLPTDIVVGDGLHISNIAYSDDVIQTTILYKRTTPKLYTMRGPNMSYTSTGGTRRYTSEELTNSDHTNQRNALLDSEEDFGEGLKERLKELETDWRAELYGTPLAITDEISRYFHTNTEDQYLTTDYSSFENFVHYSSARKRLDVFIFKLAKVSEIDRQAEQIRSAWRNSTPEKFSKLSYDGQMQTLRSEKLDIVLGFDGYERFLYFEDMVKLTEEAQRVQEEIDRIILTINKNGLNDEYEEKLSDLKKQLLYTYVSWPRADFDCDAIDDWSDTVLDYRYGDPVMHENAIWLVKDNQTPNVQDIPGHSDMWELFCACGECVGKKIPMSDASYIFLSARVYYRPQPIPASMADFAQSPAYAWYSAKATEADFYDKHNDNSLLNNTPEFITRDDENVEYFDFINFIGHQFDLIHLYVEGIGTIRKPLNNPEKGIPNDMVTHMLNYFGGSFSGYDDGEISALVKQVKTKEHLDFIKKFKERKTIIWRRILNNLPQILKAVGTEQSIRALFRCYGVPDYLFRIREFGGVEYNTDLSDEALYSFDTFDYYLTITQKNQYIEIDWGNPNYDINSLEFRIGLDESQVDIYNSVEVVTSPGAWTFGYEPYYDADEPIYGRFYFKTFDTDGQSSYKITYLKDVQTREEWVYPFKGVKYDVLIRRNAGEIDEDRRGIQIYVKRAEGQDIIYESYAETTTDEFAYNSFYNRQQPTTITFGNYVDSNFFGRMDRLRMYEHPLSETRFVNHILFNQSYDTDNPHTLDDDLIFKANFDYPYSLASTDTEQYGVIENTSFRKDTPRVARCYNFNQLEYPYGFAGENIRHFARLPSYGAQVFNNNKVRIETQELVTQLSVASRSTLKSNDRLTADTNTVGVYFSASDLINHEIIRFFGNFKLGDYIGNPEDLYNETYKEFEGLREMFYRHGFGKLDFTAYLNIVESYVDPSLFENLKKLVPARSRLIAGLVVEPTLLERPKIQRRPIANEMLTLRDIYFNMKPSTESLVTHANRRDYTGNLSESDVTGYKFYAKHNSVVSTWHPTEFNMNSVKDVPNELMYGANAYQGVSSGYKIETFSPIYNRYTREQQQTKKYQAIKISGSILSESSFNCVFYGKLGSAITSKKSMKKHIAWIHKDTTINGEHPQISGGFNPAGYAKFSYVFNGHRVVGKLYGDFSGQIQEGTVNRLRVLGRIGGNVYDECSKDSLDGSILKNLIKTEKLNSAANRTTSDDQTRTKLVEETFTDGDVNAVPTPNTIQKKVPIDIEYDTHFTLQNTSKGVSNVKGEYSGNLHMGVTAVFRPPTVATFDIEWQRGRVVTDETGKDAFQKTETLLKIQQSTYDYVHNIVSSETYVPPTTLDDELNLKVKLVSEDVTILTTEQRDILNKLNRDDCPPSKFEEYLKSQESKEKDESRYNLVGDATLNGYDFEKFYVSTKPPVSLQVGDRIYLQGVNMSYTACPSNSYTEFNDQYYTISKIAHNEDTGLVDIEFPHGKDNLSTKCGGLYETGGSVGLIPAPPREDENAYDIGSVIMLYEYDIPFGFTQQLRTPVEDTNKDGAYDTFKRNIPLKVSCKDGNFSASWEDTTQADKDGNPLMGKVDLELANEVSLEELETPTEKKQAESEWFFGEGVTTDEGLPPASCQAIYRLKINVNMNNPSVTIARPMIIDENISIGDTVEVVFRKGSYLWHPSVKGLETMTGLVTRMVDEAGGQSISLKDSAGNTESFVVDSSHVYSLRIVRSSDETHTKKIGFTKEYSEKLRGISGSEQRFFPGQDSKKVPIKISASTYVVVEKPFEYYNIVDIGNPNFKILEGKLPQHKSNVRNVFSQTSKRRGDVYCRRSVSSVNTTVSSPTSGFTPVGSKREAGIPDRTPPITRKRKTGIQGGLGDSFWYLEDEPVADHVECGLTETLTTQETNISECDALSTPTPTTGSEYVDPTDLLKLDSLQLHYTFESTDGSQTINDESGNNRHGTLHSARIRDGGESRLYRKLLQLDNDVRVDSENTNSYLEVAPNLPFSTKKLTISFWVKPIGVSEDDVGIVINNSADSNERHGIIMNPSGNQFALGYAWEGNESSHNVDLGANLSSGEWSHVVILIYAEGFIRTFVNKWFVANYDLGVRHEEVTFDKLEIGRFSGMIDDLRIYDEVLDYGDVMLAKEASGMVAELYDATRKIETPDPRDADQCELQQYDFTYYETPGFINANEMYIQHPGKDPVADPEVDSKRKFVIRGGPNEGKNKNATSEFMGSLCGRLKEIV